MINKTRFLKEVVKVKSIEHISLIKQNSIIEYCALQDDSITFKEHIEFISRLRAHSNTMRSYHPIIFNIDGPRYKLSLAQNKINIKKDQVFSIYLHTGPIAIIQQNLSIDQVKTGHEVNLGDKGIALVLSVENDHIKLIAMCSFSLFNLDYISNLTANTNLLSYKDQQILKLGSQLALDGVIISLRTKEDGETISNILRNSEVHVIAALDCVLTEDCLEHILPYAKAIIINSNKGLRDPHQFKLVNNIINQQDKHLLPIIGSIQHEQDLYLASYMDAYYLSESMEHFREYITYKITHITCDNYIAKLIDFYNVDIVASDCYVEGLVSATLAYDIPFLIKTSREHSYLGLYNNVELIIPGENLSWEEAIEVYAQEHNASRLLMINAKGHFQFIQLS